MDWQLIIPIGIVIILLIIYSIYAISKWMANTVEKGTKETMENAHVPIVR